MESRNPILGRSDAFGRGGSSTSRVPSDRDLQQMYDAPSYAPPGRMTIDDVVMRTAATLSVLVVAGAAAWVLGLSLSVAMIALFVGLGLAMVNIFKRQISPPLVLAYAAAEGVVLGVISHVYASAYSGIVVQAVLGTVLAFIGMLAAYGSGLIKVTSRFVKGVIGAGIALVGLMVLNLVVSLFTDSGLGLRADTPLGILFSLAAIVIGCLFLALDFHAVEQGIKAGTPEREAWRAAFGLTVTLVWIYLEILRLLSYLRE